MTTPTPAPRVTLPVPDACTVALQYDVAGQPAYVILGCGNTPGAGPPFDVAQALAHEFHTQAKTLMSASTTLRSIVARALDGSGNSQAFALPTGLTGTAAGTLITAYATLLRWQTSGNGRSGRGRTYVPGFTSELLESNGRAMSPVGLTRAQAVVTALTDDAGGSAPFAVISRTKGTYSPVLSGTVSPIVGIQRRRLRD